MKKITLLLCLLFVFCSGYGQLTPEDKLGIWYDIGGNHKISEKSSIDTYTQFWLYEFNDNFNFFLFKLGYHYHFSSKLTASLFLGYSDFDGHFDTSSSHTYENRITEQLTFKHKLHNIPLDHRLRVEHRFFRKPNSKPKVARLRYRIGSKFNINPILFVRIHDELLLTPKSSNTAENRFYTGLGINLTKSSNLQIGYMNRNTSNKKNLHRIQVGMFFKTDLRKKIKTAP